MYWRKFDVIMALYETVIYYCLYLMYLVSYSVRIIRRKLGRVKVLKRWEVFSCKFMIFCLSPWLFRRHQSKTLTLKIFCFFCKNNCWLRIRHKFASLGTLYHEIVQYLCIRPYYLFTFIFVCQPNVRNEYRWVMSWICERIFRK